MPIYTYKDMVTGRLYEVVQKITEPAFKTLTELHHRVGYTNPLRDNPIERQISDTVGAIITGAGVYKPGLIAAASHSKPKTKTGVTKITIEDILAREAEEEDDE